MEKLANMKNQTFLMLLILWCFTLDLIGYFFLNKPMSDSLLLGILTVGLFVIIELDKIHNAIKRGIVAKVTLLDGEQDEI